ncbi:MAG TPA: hypothetical protein VMT12_13140 [Syntrophales bacterium]|nr:hypothetical protein [Syntrophales bacterium]
MCFLILLISAPLVSFADVVGCQCYCGKFLRAPCGDEDCKRACGWQEPSAPSAGSSYDYEAERRRQEEAKRRRIEAERQRQQEIEEQEKREEAEAKQRQEEFERNKRDAINSMKGVTDGELGLKGIGTPDEFGLKGVSGDKSGIKESADLDPKDLTNKLPRAQPPTTKEKKTIPFQKGYRDASECYESSRQVSCLSASPKGREKCVALYDAGYKAGMFYQEKMMEAAFTYGKTDGGDGKKNQSFNHPDAKGPCRVKWIESYNDGYFKGKAARENR